MLKRKETVHRWECRLQEQNRLTLILYLELLKVLVSTIQLTLHFNVEQ